MSEIKFACPHCGQHIACDSGYASLDITCPSCAGTLVVPRLLTVGSQHPDAVIMASTPLPKRNPTSPDSTFGAWTTKEWEHRYDELIGAAPEPSSSWLVAGCCTLILAAVLKAAEANVWLIALCVLIGCVMSGMLAAKNKVEGQSAGYQILKVLTYIGTAILLLPAIALGILFLGCAVCH